ncbi:MAG: transcriptional repressor [Clostridia bacterium]|nr:transcriptional repressor [Clostridia bacterium]
MKYNTGKREQIIRFLRINSSRSFTLEEISEEITTDGHGRSTVYRIVSELVSEGKLRRLSDGKTRHCTYQYIGDDECSSHLHLKCRDCGRLIHLEDDISHEFAAALLSLDGFTLDAGAMLFGKCKDCKTGDFTDTSKEHVCHKAHNH